MGESDVRREGTTPKSKKMKTESSANLPKKQKIVMDLGDLSELACED